MGSFTRTLSVAMAGILLALGATDVAHAAQGDRIATISGDLTGMNFIRAVTADRNGKIYVANADAGKIQVFAANANGNVAPIAQISDADGYIDGLHDVEVDAAGKIYAASTADGVLIFAPGTTGNVTPARTISTVPAYGLAIGHDGKIYVSGFFDGSANVFAANASGTDAPLVTLTWSPLDFPQARDIAVDNEGRIYLPSYKSPRRIMVWDPGYQTGDDPDREIALETVLDDPAGIDVDCASGDLVVSNSDDDEILLFNANDPSTATGTVIDSGYEAEGLGFGLAGNLYIADRDASAIYVVEWDTECQYTAVDDDEGLAATGADSGTVGIVAAMLAGVAGVALMVRRRRA